MGSILPRRMRVIALFFITLFVVGTLGLIGLLGSVGVVTGGAGVALRGWAVSDFWLLFGGVAGVGFIVTSIISVRRLGVLVFSLLLIVGQMLVAPLPRGVGLSRRRQCKAPSWGRAGLVPSATWL